jgi:hypothetical protein
MVWMGASCFLFFPPRFALTKISPKLWLLSTWSRITPIESSSFCCAKQRTIHNTSTVSNFYWSQIYGWFALRCAKQRTIHNTSSVHSASNFYWSQIYGWFALHIYYHERFQERAPIAISFYFCLPMGTLWPFRYRILTAGRRNLQTSQTRTCESFMHFITRIPADSHNDTNP